MVAGREWAKRHGARKDALRDLREQLKNEQITGLDAALGATQKPSLLYEALVLEDARPFKQSGYRAVFRIDDTKTKMESGTFTWSTEGSGPSSTYAQNQTNVAKLRKAK